MGNSVGGASLLVTNGLVLNGIVLIGNPTNSWYGQVGFAGTEALSGSGTVVFGNGLTLNGTMLVGNPSSVAGIGGP